MWESNTWIRLWSERWRREGEFSVGILPGGDKEGLNPKYFPEEVEKILPDPGDRIFTVSSDLLLDDPARALEKVVKEGVFAPEVGNKSLCTQR